jgi:glycosyltransferase involved in cell wall biosynthesis
MRLTVVSPFLDRLHGTELCIIEQIERLASRHSWEIHLYSQSVKDVRGLQLVTDLVADSQDSIFWHRVPALPGPHLLNYLWWFFANHWQRWRDRRSGRVRPDLVYSPGINCLDADVIVVHIVFHAFYERLRSELVLRRVPLRSWPRLIHRKLYYKLIMFLERRIYRDPGVHLVAVSSLVALQLKSHFQRDDVTVISNAVDTTRFTPEALQGKRIGSRKLFQYVDNEFVILLIGNDWKKKGLGTLLMALGLLTELPLRVLVVGSDDPDFYRPLLDQIVFRDRIRFEKPSADVLCFYAAADLYVGPSLEDAFNLPILEAMACGLPVIASVHAGSSENIIDGRTGILLEDPQDYTLLAQLIRQMFNDEFMRGRIGGAAARSIQANCSWDRNVENTKQLLERTLHLIPKR